MFEIEKGNFERFVRMLGKIADEGTIEITKDGFKSRVVDFNHVCLLEAELDKRGFINYEDMEKKINVNFDRLFKTLKLFHGNIKIDITDKYITLYNEHITKKMLLLENENEIPKLPELKLTIKARDIYTGLLSTLLKDCLDEKIILKAKGGKLFASMDGDTEKIDVLLSENVDGEGKSAYAYEYLKDFVSVIPTYSIKIEYDVDLPLKISGEGFRYYLAPRVV